MYNKDGLFGGIKVNYDIDIIWWDRVEHRNILMFCIPCFVALVSVLSFEILRICIPGSLLFFRGFELLSLT